MSPGGRDSLETAGRLAALMQAVGFALWQLQELENTAASFIAVRLRNTRGVGLERGGEIAAEVEGRTLGGMVKELVAGGVISDEIGSRLAIVLEERNWLVHRARRETRGILGNDDIYGGTMQRLEVMADRSLALTRELGAAVEAYVIESGVSPEFIEQEGERIARSWGVDE